MAARRCQYPQPVWSPGRPPGIRAQFPSGPAAMGPDPQVSIPQKSAVVPMGQVRNTFDFGLVQLEFGWTARCTKERETPQEPAGSSLMQLMSSEKISVYLARQDDASSRSTAVTSSALT